MHLFLMPQTIDQSGQTHMDKSVNPGGLRHVLTSPQCLSGIVLALLVWFIAPAIDSFILQVDSFENTLLHPDSREIWMRSIISSILLAFGFVSSLVIERARRAERNLYDFEKIVNGATEIMALIDSNFVYRTVNDAYLRAFNKQQDEVIGKTVSDVMGNDFFENVVRPNAGQCLAGSIINFTRWFDFPGMGKRYMDISYYPHRADGNSVSGIIVIGRDITRQKQSQDELDNIRLQLKTIIDTEPECVKTVGRDGTLLSMNSAGLQLIGADSFADVSRTCVYDLIAPEHRNAFIEMNSRVFNGETMEMEFEIVGLKGERRWMQTHATPMRNEAGEIIAQLAITRDFTETRKTQELLQLHQFTVDHAADCIYWIDEEANIFDVNQSACRSLGYTREEMLSMSVIDIDPHVQKENWKSIWSNLEKNSYVHLESQHRTKDGRILDVDIQANLLDFKGTRYDCAIVRDITERKKIEHELGLVKNRLELIFNSAGEGIYGVNTDGVSTFVNAAAARMLGWEVTDLQGKSQHEMVHHSHADGTPYSREDCPVLHCIREGRPIRTTDEVFWRKDGSSFPVDYVCTPIYENNEVSGAVVVFSDVTERQNSENKLRQSEERYRAMFESSRVGMALCDLQGKLLDVNQGYLDIIGYTAAEAQALTYWDITPREYEKDEARQLESLHSTGRYGPYEKEYIHKDGSRIPVVLNGTLIQDATGNDLIWSVVQDITDRKQSERQVIENERRLQEIIWGTNVGTWEWNINSGDLVINDRWAEILGYGLDDLKPLSIDTWESLTHPDDLKVAYQILDEVFNRKVDHFEYETRMRHRSGDWVWVLDRGMVVEWSEDGKPLRMSGTHTDITAKKTAELALENRTDRLLKNQSALIQLAKEDFTDLQVAFKTIVMTAAEQLDVSRVAVWLYNDERTAVECYVMCHEGELQKTDMQLLKSEHPLYFDALEEEGVIAAVDARNDPRTSEFIHDYLVPMNVASMLDVPIRLQGEIVGIVCHECAESMRQWDVEDVDFATSIAEMCAVALSASDRKKARELLTYQASHDPLTNLSNRFEFERCAEKLIHSAQSDSVEHALCFLDLDQFKVVNDTCGHTAGDELLRQLGQVLHDRTRKRDTLARLGGDEFGILMEDCTKEQASRVANTILKSVQDYQFNWQGHTFRVGVSIGVVSINETTGNVSELLKQADAACYMAKDLGRNRIHVYHHEDVDLARRHGEMQWVARINHALENDRFVLYAQPIVPLDRTSGSNHELLVRMLDENGATIPPGAFLPAAERYDLISRVDSWVIRNAFEILVRHQRFIRDVGYVSINLSGQSLVDEEMLDFINAYLTNSGIDAAKICFEITETAAISNLNMANHFISTLKATGCRFALDDFGSGLSSFGYLKNLDVDFLKIDGMFVRNIATDQIDHAMVRSINEVGQVMGMQTIAEFVENDEIKGMLREIGVNYGQGYGIGKPVPLDDVLRQSGNVTSIRSARGGDIA